MLLINKSNGFQACVDKGAWVMVEYDGDMYPGIVTELSTTEGYKVKVMRKSLAGWKWPATNDEIWYQATKVVRVPENPIPRRSRNEYIFPDI